jgi:hypothetical protein
MYRKKHGKVMDHLKVLTPNYFERMSRNTANYMRFKVLRVVSIMTRVLQVIIPCTLVDRYQRFGGTCCVHLQCRAWTMKMGTVLFSET